MLGHERDAPLSLLAKEKVETSPATLTTVKRSEVPKYLHQSELYLSLNDEDDDEISIPDNCMKMNLDFNDDSDLEHLLLTMRYWIRHDFPDEAIAFMLKEQSPENICILQRHQREHPNVHGLVLDLCLCKSADQCAVVCHYGQLNFLNFFVKQGMAITVDGLQAAANNGQLECLLHVYKILEGEEILPANLWKVDLRPAASAGHLDCLQFLMQAGKRSSIDMCICAARWNQLQVLKYVIEPFKSRFESDDMREQIILSDIWEAAAEAEGLDCLEYFMETFPALATGERVAAAACRHNRTNVLKWFLARDCVPMDRVVRQAAFAGSLESLIFLHDEFNAQSWVPSTVMTASMRGHYTFTLQLLQRGCPFDRACLMEYLDDLEEFAERMLFLPSPYYLEIADVLGSIRALIMQA